MRQISETAAGVQSIICPEHSSRCAITKPAGLQRSSVVIEQPGESGFTLIEMVVAITVTGILAAVMAVFLRTPLKSYQNIALRASLTDAAETVLRRMSRDLRNALPNSIRVTTIGGVTYLEYLEVRTAGRYRGAPETVPIAPSCPAGGLGAGFEDTLETSFSDSCFLTLGDVPDLSRIVAGDALIIYNLGVGNTGADAYAGTNRATLISAVATATPGVNQINFSTFTFPLESPEQRFFVVSGPVTYACNPGAGTLTRIGGYAINAIQPTPPAAAGSLLTDRVSQCGFVYDANAIAQRTGIVSINLELSQAPPDGGPAERVHLFQQVHVNNVP